MNERTWPLLLIASPIVLGAVASSLAGQQPLTVYVGTYTDGASRGIYRFDLDTDTGHASPPVLAAEARNPSFLALHPSGRFLYAVSEVSDFGGARTGGVIAFAIDPPSGRLTRLNEEASGGDGPCHLAVDETGQNLLVANYGGGTVALLRITADGRLKPASTVLAHEGSGPDKERQDKPHAHGVYFDPAQRFVLAPDLGADRVFVYAFDAERGRLEPHGAGVLPPGSGPRHLAFHPSGRFVYVINELASTVSVFRYDAASGALALVQTLSALPEGFAGTSYTAEVQVSPDGRFLYGSNRGHDSLAIFSIDASSGQLSPLGHVPIGGSWPRHFQIDASGRLLMAAHQRGGTIGFFRLDARTGQASPLGARVAVDRPACVLPVARPR
jgi:6-phosphogluconolactonase